jgi:bacterioferritin-associated ferredoxin
VRIHIMAWLDNENGIHYLRRAMYVCVCLAVSEAEVDAAIAAGAVTREAVTRSCKAGGDCGACHGMIDAKIEDHLEAQAVRCQAQASTTGGVEESGPVLVSAASLVRGRAA